MLAGSALTMIDAVRNLHALGVPLERCARARRPRFRRACSAARASAGSRVGLPADIVVLDDNLEIERVLVGGRDPCRLLRRPSRCQPRRARSSWRRSASSPPRCGGCSSSAGDRAGRRGRSASAARDRPPRRARLVRQRRLVRRLRVRPRCRGWTAVRDSITLTVHYGAELDMAGATALGALAVGANAGRGRVPRARARQRGVHGRAHERPGVRARRARPRPSCRSRPGTSRRSPRRRRT